MSMLTRDGLPNPSRETKFSGANGDKDMLFSPVQLTTSRIGDLTWLILTPAIYVMTIHTYRRRTPDGNGNENGDGSEDSSGGGDGDEDNGNGNKDIIGEGGREAKKRKKTQKSCRRRAGNGGDSVGSVAADPDNLESNKKAGGGAQGTQGSSKNCASRKSVSPLSRLIRGFSNKYH